MILRLMFLATLYTAKIRRGLDPEEDGIVMVGHYISDDYVASAEQVLSYSSGAIGVVVFIVGLKLVITGAY